MLQDLKTQLGQSMKSVRGFLQKPIKLDEGNLRLGVPDSRLRADAREAQRQRVRRMRRDLFDLLGQHPSSRQTLRHLAAVERTLQAKGLEGFDTLPVRIIARALVEMETIVRDWSPTGLAELRSRMGVIVKDRPAEALPRHPGPPNGGFGVTLPAVVSEVDHAEFEEMERSWVGVMPTLPAPTDAPATPAVSA